MRRILYVDDEEQNLTVLEAAFEDEFAIDTAISAREDPQLSAKLGLDDSTIVFFTSDNGGYRLGEELFHGNANLRGGKGNFYEGGLRVPLIVRWPERIEEGKTDDWIGAFWDIMPTLAELAGAACPDKIDGISFAPLDQ